MKRLLSLLMCLVLALSLIPAAAAEDIQVIETEDDPITVIDPEIPAEPEDTVSNSDSGVYMQRADWVYDNHVLYLKHHNWATGGIITYAMYEDERPWFQYINEIQTVVLDEGCVEINSFAFHDYLNLRQITIPYTVENIFTGAFQNCPELQSVTLPGIPKIYDRTFEGCSSLSSVTIPSNVLEVGQYAFADTAIQSLEFSTNLTKLNDYALADMSSLSTVTFKGSVPVIGENSFNSVTATIYTPTGSRAWPASAMQDYGGHLTWANRPIEPITSVAVTITAPSPGAAPDYNPVLPYGANYYSDDYNTSNYKNDVRWQYSGGGYLAVDSAIFEAGEAYAVFIYLTPKDGYAFAESCTGSINGKTAQVHLESSGQLRVSYHFPALASAPTITTQPKSVSTTAGSTAKFTVAATDATSYQWQYRTSSTGSWNNSTASSAKTATLSITAESYRSGYQYRCKVTNSAGTTTSNAATLTVVTKPTITTQPKSVSTTLGNTAKFTVAASGGSLSYQWQWRSSSSGTWKDCTSATTGYHSATLQVSATSSRNGYQYRCKVTNAAGTATSSTVTLTVTSSKPTITTQPTSKTAAAGSTAKFSVAATGATSYQWQWRSSSSGTWADCTSATSGYHSGTLQVSATTARNGYQYRCKVTNSAGTTTSNTATLTVVTKPTITTQPTSKTATAGTTVKFTVAATGGALSYQWQFRSSSSASWSNCSGTGATTATLSVEAKAYRNGYQYRCLVFNVAGSVYSNTATLTVK